MLVISDQEAKEYIVTRLAEGAKHALIRQELGVLGRPMTLLDYAKLAGETLLTVPR
jgi:hypothetical protein